MLSCRKPQPDRAGGRWRAAWRGCPGSAPRRTAIDSCSLWDREHRRHNRCPGGPRPGRWPSVRDKVVAAISDANFTEVARSRRVPPPRSRCQSTYLRRAAMLTGHISTVKWPHQLKTSVTEGGIVTQKSPRALAARARILAVKHAHLLEDSVDRLHVFLEGRRLAERQRAGARQVDPHLAHDAPGRGRHHHHAV